MGTDFPMTKIPLWTEPGIALDQWENTVLMTLKPTEDRNVHRPKKDEPNVMALCKVTLAQWKWTSKKIGSQFFPSVEKRLLDASRMTYAQ